MIVFPMTNHDKLYNYVIHNFLKKTAFKNPKSLDRIMKRTLYKTLYREQYYRCKTAYEHLYELTQNKETKTLKLLENVVLCLFLDYISYFEDEPEFKDYFFDQKANKLIKQAAKEDKKEDEIYDGKELYDYDYEEKYYEVSGYEDSLFSDTDFRSLSKLYNSYDYSEEKILYYLGTNLDYYYELLPMDIQNKYITKNITLYGNTCDFVDFVKDQVENHELWKIFWNNKEPINLDQIGTIIDNLMTSYYYDKGVEYYWNFYVDKYLDFKIKKRFHENQVLLLRFITPGNFMNKKYLKELLDTQEDYYKVIYVFMAFTEKEYKKINWFINNVINQKQGDLYIQHYINYQRYDIRPKESASKAL